ncbi:hypothetical protein GSI_04901 [Ganoderma sinense ZZ0214-1]|uniref:HMG box domain-containing protein n=1 Tax=Ganoderma sinense ZZ0214-1 TaxID=1077348 RepID=A0A2G8SG91_9APHY|nr:hypothetical protein GSI_04901 [Ganoderma sinense ZZ0214-1]
MANPRFREEQVLERFRTREAVINLLLATKHIDNVKMKFMNRFICFRKIYNVVRQTSLSVRQDEVSKVMGAAWHEEAAQNPDFWNGLYRDFVAGHKARFPYYWQKKKELEAMTPEERKAELAKLPDPEGKRMKKRDHVEGKQRPRARAAPYTVPGLSSSSSRSRLSRSSASSSPSTTSQGPSSAVPLVPTPPTIPVHHSAPLPAPVYPFNQPSLPVYPSPQPSHLMSPEAYAALPTPRPAQYYDNAPLNGGQYMAAPTHPAPVTVPQPPSLGMPAQIHAAWTNVPAVPAGAYHQPMTMTATHSASWTTSATVPRPSAPYIRQSVNSMAPPAALVPFHETGFGYETYQLGMTGEVPPSQSASFPSYQVPNFPSHPMWPGPSPDVTGLPIAPAPWAPQIGIRARL